jgi:AcrR family transcriptional regulator
MAIDEPRARARARTRQRRRPALTRRDWLVAGQDLLRAGGVQAVKLAALTRALGVTTGSFYHHFVDMAAYLDALADHWGDTQPAEALPKISEGTPLQRLIALDALHRANDMESLDRAMRMWAYHDQRAKAAVRKADARLLEFLESAFVDLGFGRETARARALLTFSAGAANVYPPWRVDGAARQRMLEVLTAGA